MTDINNFISEMVREKDKLDMPVFLNFLRDELDRKGIKLTINRSSDLHLVPLNMSNIIGVELDLSDHDKKKNAEIEKYKKAFEDAKCERNKVVCEYRNKIDQLKSRVMELEKYLEDLPFEPIKIAEYLMDRTIEVKNTFPALQGGETSIVPVHDLSELRQIAEHLLFIANMRRDEMTASDIQNIEKHLNEMLYEISKEKTSLNAREVESKLSEIEIESYREKFYESMYCNLSTCRYNQNGMCQNKYARKDCIELCRKVLCMEE